MRFFNKQKIFNLFLISVVLFGLVGCDEEVIATQFDELEDAPKVVEVKKSIKSKKPVAIGFFANWCPHCRKYKPVFSDVEEIFDGEVTFVHVDIDDKESKPLVNLFMVRGVPATALISVDGTTHELRSGGLSKERLISLVEDLRKQ